jgi:hypothetical protein
MTALTVALFAAALAVLGNILFSLWRDYRERRSIAAALAGEIGAYMQLLDPPKAAEHYRKLAAIDYPTRCQRLRAFPKSVEGHPVFDKVAEKIGLLPATEALDVSMIYNIVTGMRTVLGNLSTTEFADGDDAMQIATLSYIADTLDQRHQPTQDLIRRLRRIAEESPWQFLRSITRRTTSA